MHARSCDTAPYEDVIATADPLAEAELTTHDDILTTMYTSGTIGRPKGAMITQGMTFWNAINWVEFFSLSESMVNIAFLPLFHTGGLDLFANPAFHLGGTTPGHEDVRSGRDPGPAHQRGDRRHPHHRGAGQLAVHEPGAGLRRGLFPHLIGPAVGGSPTPVPLIEAWAAKGLPLQQAFGMTETSPLVLSLKPEDCEIRVGSAGLPAMHTEAKVVDEQGGPTPVGETGELWVRGPNITPGYWNKLEATAEAFTDGWLRREPGPVQGSPVGRFHRRDPPQRDRKGPQARAARLARCPVTSAAAITIPDWAQGRPGMGQGGYAAHQFAEAIGEPVAVNFRSPIPLLTPLVVDPTDEAGPLRDATARSDSLGVATG